MTYTINGKEYTEFDINLRCAELLGFEIKQTSMVDEGNIFVIDMSDHLGELYRRVPQYCSNPADTDAIIDKCFNELNESILRNGGRRKSHWQDTMKTHKCTKLVAACICYIEMQEGI
jgi:hypothetical protein